MRRNIRDVIFGLAVGDALGVPVEFKSREALSRTPVRGMIGYGSYNLPPGTWSDDSSLTFCLVETLIEGFDLNLLSRNFMRWLYEAWWTPRGDVFDVGIGTRQAIDRLRAGERPDLAGGLEAHDNGNGALMRILPLLFHIHDKEIDERYRLTRLAGVPTHGHIRSVIACFYYLEYARALLQGKDQFEAYEAVQPLVLEHLSRLEINPMEVAFYDRLLRGRIYELDEEQISSTGYVVHTLEASLWCLLTTDSYAEAVLRAVNLGGDTDTTGAVTGGLAGLLYGREAIPAEWIDELARREDLDDLADRFEAAMG